MSNNLVAPRNRDARLENFAAELTFAAYGVALRHGTADSWIRVELALWRALAQTVKMWAPERPPTAHPDEFKAWREGLLVDLTDSAYYVALKHGIRGSLVEVESRLDRAFRFVIERRYGVR